MPLVVSASVGWPRLLDPLPPGDHAAILTATSVTGIVGRLAGLELRDVLAVLLPGPSSAFVFLFRKPLFEPTVAAQTLRSGTGALNIAGCRIGLSGGTRRSGIAQHLLNDDGTEDRSHHWARTGHTVVEIGVGRWPPNVLIVHTPECARIDRQNQTLPMWTCSPTCPVPILDTLSGPTIVGRVSQEASRFYPQFGNEAEMLRWLATLVGATPPGS